MLPRRIPIDVGVPVQVGQRIPEKGFTGPGGCHNVHDVRRRNPGLFRLVERITTSWGDLRRTKR